ncbi:MAG: hypothetical protein WB819_11780 [Terriglobia bacterium]|jgi:uncharacterized membrane protein
MMRLSCAAGLLALILFAIPAWAVKKPHRIKLTKLDTLVYVAAEFDAATTYHLLQNCGSRCYEANPMVRPFARNPGIFFVAGASAYAVNTLSQRLKNNGHSRWAKALRVVAIGAHVFAGAHAVAADH